MTKITYKSLASVLVVATLLSGCALKKMKKKQNTIGYEVVPAVMEVHGDSVKVVVNGVIPKKYFAKKATAELKPVVRYNGKSTDLVGMTLQGEKIKGEGTAIIKKTGGEFSYTNKFAYTPEMKKSELFLNISAKKGKKSVDFTEVKLAEGMITTSQSVKATEELVIGKDNYVKVVPVEKKGTIFFEIDRSVVRDSEKKSTEVKGFDEFIKAGHKLTGISISSYASPDGELRRNDLLSEERTNSTYKFLLAYLKSKGVEQVNDSAFYKKSATAEDWDGLKQLVGQSDIGDRDEIIRIVTTMSDVDQREKEIKKLSSYKKLADSFLPKLRRSEVTLLGTEKRKSDADITRLASSSPSELTSEELLYASTLTTDNNEKMRIYEQFNKSYPTDWRGFNNIAYMNLSKGEKVDESLELLDKANTLSRNNAVVLNNVGVAYKMKNDYKKAEGNFLLAKSFGGNEAINLGNIKIKQGDYNSALAYYGSANGCTYNSALANTLAGNFEMATKNIDCAKQDASTYYLKAIIGARSANLDMMTTNLTRAIKEDASYRATATTDLEFKAYYDNDAFKAAVR